MKKFLLGAAMLAAMVFTSCIPDAIQQDGTIKYDNSFVIIEEDGTVTQGKEKGKNGAIPNPEEGGWYYREIEDSAFKHYGGTATITVSKDKELDKCGNAGFIFGLKRNPDKTVNFGVVTITYQESALNYYISLFKNVNLEEGYSKNSSFSDKNGKEITSSNDLNVYKNATGGDEHQITPKSGVWTKIEDTDAFLDENNNNYVVKVSVEADEVGGYTVKLFGLEDDEAVFKHEISKEETGFEKKDQTEFGYYAMIRPGKYFEAKIDLEDYEGNPIPVYN